MIISALADYYDRAVKSGADLPRPGLEEQEIPFLIEIKNNGEFSRIKDTREGDKRGKMRGKMMFVLQNCGRTTGIKANLLWDNIEYALGCAEGDIAPDGKVQERHQAFIDRLKELPPDIVSMPEISKLIRFLESEDKLQAMRQDGLWQELIQSRGNKVSFVYQDGDNIPVCADKDILSKLLDAPADGGEEQALCIISGEKADIERLHSPIKGVAGAKTTGANIVSFNIAPFCSYGKEQGSNSPVSASVVFRYTTALNHLLRHDSPQKARVGDTTVAFWARENNAIEENLPAFFSGTKPGDNPDQYTERMKELFDSVYTAANADDDDTGDFYILGLSPNAARIAVRFWHKTTVREVAKNIRAYFENTRIIAPAGRDERLSIYRILRSVAVLENMDNLSPLLAGQFVKAIFAGQQYPLVLLQAAVIRCRAEKKNKDVVTYERAATIKACLITHNTRNLSISPEKKEELRMLNTSETKPAYVLGRLFAVLDKIQEEAMGKLKSPIRTRYYGAASSAPCSVFPTLLKLSHHHVAKLRDKAQEGKPQRNYEKMKGEIMNLLPADPMPSHLPLQEQGFFALGFYHQRQFFFTKKEEVSNDD